MRHYRHIVSVLQGHKQIAFSWRSFIKLIHWFSLLHCFQCCLNLIWHRWMGFPAPLALRPFSVHHQYIWEPFTAPRRQNLPAFLNHDLCMRDCRDRIHHHNITLSVDSFKMYNSVLATIMHYSLPSSATYSAGWPIWDRRPLYWYRESWLHRRSNVCRCCNSKSNHAHAWSPHI